MSVLALDKYSIILLLSMLVSGPRRSHHLNVSIGATIGSNYHGSNSGSTNDQIFRKVRDSFLKFSHLFATIPLPHRSSPVRGDTDGPLVIQNGTERVIDRVLNGIGDFSKNSSSPDLLNVDPDPDYWKNSTSLWPRGVLRSYYPGRLGNNMFQYAALLGISNWNNVTPVIHMDSPLLEIFDLLTNKKSSSSSGSPVKVIHPDDVKRAEWTMFGEQKLAFYDNRFRAMDLAKYNAIGYYFQSWRYFKHVEERVRRSFTFRPTIRFRADAFWNGHVTSVLEAAKGPVVPLVIGIHVRRGDFTKDIFRLVASREWIMTAMLNFEKKFAPRPIVYLVCSNGIGWCEQNLSPNNNDSNRTLIFSKNNSRELDLALLTRCDHTIMTAGSFGWWASYLAGGDVIYMREHVKPKSWLAAFFNEPDYMPPHWLGL